MPGRLANFLHQSLGFSRVHTVRLVLVGLFRQPWLDQFHAPAIDHLG
jgi:hypothetical protein